MKINKKIYSIILIIVLCLCSSYSCVLLPRKLEDPHKLVFKPLEFTSPHVERIELSNGMVIYFLEDHELPLLTINALFKTGSVFDPDDKLGLAELTGEVIRSGGTKRLSPEELNETLEYMAASIETSIGRETGSASLSILSKDTDKGLTLFSEILMSPQFDDKRVELAKEKKLEGIRRRNDNPTQAAFRKFGTILYKDDPRGREEQVEYINNITREDMIKFYKIFFRPNNCILGISGDFNRNEMIQKLENLFSGWERVEGLPQIPIPAYRFQTSMNYIYKDTPQSTIVFGHYIIPKTDSAYYAFEVLNYILGGGGFNSRLMREIRSNRGLAYSVGSFYRAESKYGVFGTYCMTNASTTYLTTSLIYEVIKDIKSGNLTQEELDWAKEAIVNQYIFSFSSTEKIVAQQIELEYDELPQSFFEEYPEKIRMLTLEDVKLVAQKYLRPEEGVLLILGNEKLFDKELSNLGVINKIELEKN
ncbi:MAG: pitrilysin family protein [bacterium]